MSYRGSVQSFLRFVPGVRVATATRYELVAASASIVRSPYRFAPSIASGRVAFGQPLTHLVDVPLKHEQTISVAVGIGEVVLLALANLDLQVLVQIVHDELLEIAERRREAIVLVVGLVANALRRCHQLSLARSHA